MPGRSELSRAATRTSACDLNKAISALRDPDLIATVAVAAIGLLITAVLMRATDGADLALALVAPLN
jgi:hypothetical protein